MMIEFTYFLSVFKNPGYVTEGEKNLSESQKFEMRQRTFILLEKVRLLSLE